ncbi:MAG: DUF6391 domain-containing protein [Chloroflexi bacterium]|nr:DUF6391 domain-containing protein [Chloroflexota bacterium]
MNLLELPIISHTRRNHGLEHATIHVLSSHSQRLRVAGRATPKGFFIYGNLTTEELAAAVDEAIRRMQAGEKQLAVHPGCGTNLVTTGVIAGAMSFVATMLMGKRARWYDRLPNMAVAGVAGVALSKPFGPWLQANVTTSADMRGMHVRHITRTQMGPMITHFVETTS